jgi:dihydrofolate reductase
VRKIILCLATSLDGYISGPKGEMDWLVRDESVDFGDVLTDILDGVDTIFYGRISYDLWGNYHPGETVSQKLKAAYELLHSKTKYVFSRTKFLRDNNVIFINTDIEENVSEILRQPGENIWLYGGGKLITTFMNLNIIDEYRLAVHPVILGEGVPLFNEIKRRIGLGLKNVQTSPSGVVLLHYERED